MVDREPGGTTLELRPLQLQWGADGSMVKMVIVAAAFYDGGTIVIEYW